MTRLLAYTLAATTALALPALAASQPQRVRGTVTAIDAHMLVVHPDSGSDIKLVLNGDTHYLLVEKSSMSKIAKGSFIGTATKTMGTTQVALEVVVFPPSMNGTGEGHYAWDKLPDTTGAKTSSAMTNGTVASAAPDKTASTMTNGTVATAGSKAGAKDITVTYKGGEQKIIVPPNVPVVTFKPAQMSAVTKGARVFVKALDTGGTLTAQAVAVGAGGVKPPM